MRLNWFFYVSKTTWIIFMALWGPVHGKAQLQKQLRLNISQEYRTMRMRNGKKTAWCIMWHLIHFGYSWRETDCSLSHSLPPQNSSSVSHESSRWFCRPVWNEKAADALRKGEHLPLRHHVGATLDSQTSCHWMRKNMQLMMHASDNNKNSKMNTTF